MDEGSGRCPSLSATRDGGSAESPRLRAIAAYGLGESQGSGKALGFVVNAGVLTLSQNGYGFLPPRPPYTLGGEGGEQCVRQQHACDNAFNAFEIFAPHL